MMSPSDSHKRKRSRDDPPSRFVPPNKFPAGTESHLRPWDAHTRARAFPGYPREGCGGRSAEGCAEREREREREREKQREKEKLTPDDAEADKTASDKRPRSARSTVSDFPR